MTGAPVWLPESLASGTLPARSLGLFVTNVSEMFAPISPPASAGYSVWSARFVGSSLPGLVFAAGSELLFDTASFVKSSLEFDRRHVEVTAQSGYRSRELKFRETNPEIFRQLVGRWVALEEEAIVAYGTDPLAVVAEARGRGVRVPYVFYVEEPRDDAAWIGI